MSKDKHTLDQKEVPSNSASKSSLIFLTLGQYYCTPNPINIEEKAYAGNATQNIHPPLMQKTRIHVHTSYTTAHTASLIHLLVKTNM